MIRRQARVRAKGDRWIGRFFAGLVLLSALAGAENVPAGVLVEDQTLLHDGAVRWFDVYEPDGVAAGALPVVVLLHGGTGDKLDMRNGATGEYFSLADREGFLLVVPNGSEADGVTGPAGDFNWNDCRGDAPTILPEADDVGFVDALLDWVEARYGIDTDRIYVTGASNGGMMSYRLAFELSERIAAVGAVIANLPAVSDCLAAQPITPISVLIMNGTADPLMLWGGGSIQGRGTVVSAHDTRDFWRAVLATDSAPTHTLYPDLAPFDAGRIESDLYAGGVGGTELLFYTVDGGGHNFPSRLHFMPSVLIPFLGPQNRDVEVAEEVWSFLSRQRLVPEPDFVPSIVVGLIGVGLADRRRRLRMSTSRSIENSALG